MSSSSTPMVPATDAESTMVQRHIRRMPFVGDAFAPHFSAVEAQPLPAINARGGRDAEGWTAVYEAVVQKDWINGMGGLHGAAACFIVDMITGTSFARLRTATWGLGGPSISIDMSYYDPAPAGTRLRIVTVIERMGGLLATARCHIYNAETGRNIASGLHTTMTPAARKRAADAAAAEKAKAKL